MSKVEVSKQYVPIVKVDEERRLVKGVVYKPYELDSQDDWMTKEDIEKTAHKFMKELKLHNIDTKHTLQKEDAYVCESYIAKEGDPEGYIEGSWVVSMKIEGDALWEDVLNGEYGGFSMFGKAFAINNVEPPAKGGENDGEAVN